MNSRQRRKRQHSWLMARRDARKMARRTDREFASAAEGVTRVFCLPTGFVLKFQPEPLQLETK